MLEKQLAELSADLESYRAELAAVGSADRFVDIEQRLVRAENELAAGDVLRDNLRADKEKVSDGMGLSEQRINNSLNTVVLTCW